MANTKKGIENSRQTNKVRQLYCKLLQRNNNNSIFLLLFMHIFVLYIFYKNKQKVFFRA